MPCKLRRQLPQRRHNSWLVVWYTPNKYFFPHKHKVENTLLLRQSLPVLFCECWLMHACMHSIVYSFYLFYMLLLPFSFPHYFIFSIPHPIQDERGTHTQKILHTLFLRVSSLRPPLLSPDACSTTTTTTTRSGLAFLFLFGNSQKKIDLSLIINHANMNSKNNHNRHCHFSLTH